MIIIHNNILFILRTVLSTNDIGMVISDDRSVLAVYLTKSVFIGKCKSDDELLFICSTEITVKKIVMIIYYGN